MYSIRKDKIKIYDLLYCSRAFSSYSVYFVFVCVYVWLSQIYFVQLK